MSFNRTNPISGEIASTSAAMSADDARATADRAAGAFLAWSQTGPNTRRQLLNAAADALEARKDDFVRATTAEIGATAGWAMFNLSLAAGMMRKAAELTTRTLQATSSHPTSPDVFPWHCGSPRVWFWGLLRGTRRSSSGCVRLLCLWRAEIP